MTRRGGSADLPLHGGRVPQWLASRMTSLGTVMTQAIVHEYGRDEFLSDRELERARREAAFAVPDLTSQAIYEARANRPGAFTETGRKKKKGR